MTISRTALILAVPMLLFAGAAMAWDVGDEPVHRERPNDPPIVLPHRGAVHPVPSRAVVRRGPFVSVQVNIDQLGDNIPGDAANEPSIAIDPTSPDVLVIGWRQFDTILSDFRQAGYAYSHDGGVTWTFPGVLEPGVFRSDPVLDSDAGGNIYYYSLRGDFECFTFISGDGGVTWTDPIPAFGGDKAWFIVDKTRSVGAGNLYSAWSTAGNPYFPNQFTRSLDGGLGYDGPFELTSGQPRPVWGTLATDSTGDLHICGQSGGDIYVLESTDAKLAGGTPTFSRQQVDLGGTFTSHGTPNPGGLLGQVWIATDTSGGPTDGNVYVLASIDPGGDDPLDVKLARSEDGGATWSAPVRVNDDPPFSTNAWQWFGTMSVAPNGRIDAIWNDTRNTPVDTQSELFYAYSTDAGQTWSRNVAASPAFDSTVGWPGQNKIGDYYHMVSENAKARLAYAATFNGEQDVYYLELGDCNGNGVHDGADIATGFSLDVDENTIPDECECRQDLDGDGNVGFSDLLAVLSGWGPCGGCAEDLDGDGEVGFSDLLIVLSTWGPCP